MENLAYFIAGTIFALLIKSVFDFSKRKKTQKNFDFILIFFKQGQKISVDELADIGRKDAELGYYFDTDELRDICDVLYKERKLNREPIRKSVPWGHVYDVVYFLPEIRI